MSYLYIGDETISRTASEEDVLSDDDIDDLELDELPPSALSEEIKHPLLEVSEDGLRASIPHCELYEKLNISFLPSDADVADGITTAVSVDPSV